MWENIQWIIAIGAGGVISAVSSIAFFRPNKRLKETEARSAEFEQLKKEVEYANKRIDDVLKDLGKSEEEKRQSRRELEASEAKRYKLKSCISRAHNCDNSERCPVLNRQRELEEEWLKKEEVKTND